MIARQFRLHLDTHSSMIIAFDIHRLHLYIMSYVELISLVLFLSCISLQQFECSVSNEGVG